MTEAPLNAGHVSLWQLRKLQAGELAATAAEATRAHLSLCDVCSHKQQALRDERLEFEQQFGFAEFAERLAQKRKLVAFKWPAKMAPLAILGFAAAAAFALVLKNATPTELPVNSQATPSELHQAPQNRLKGAHDGVQLLLRVASAQGNNQREAQPFAVENLASGERVRIGYLVAEPAYLAALSIDEKGEVTPLYPDAGRSLAVLPQNQASFLPDSIEFTGHGLERVFVVVARAPFEISLLLQQAKVNFEQAQANLKTMAAPEPAQLLSGYDWTVAKP